jgi:4-hydroxy-tetrahydrodipicolinate reductase
MVRVAVTGATGRMGREVLAAAAGRDDAEVVLAVSESADGPVEGVPVEPAGDLGTLLVEREPAALVEFTAPGSSVEYVEAAAEAGVSAVVGTTGFDEEQAARLREAADEVAVLRAANFSRGVQGLLAAVRAAVERLPGYDIEVTETHHDGKRDAPSGTAKTIIEEIDDVRTGDGALRGERVHGREGEAPRSEGEIGVHARRAGDVTGEHEVLLAGNHEAVRLTHTAGSRGVFAEGALDAAGWLADCDPGWYEFDEVIDA